MTKDTIKVLVQTFEKEVGHGAIARSVSSLSKNKPLNILRLMNKFTRDHGSIYHMERFKHARTSEMLMILVKYKPLA